jgi:hypothetical protein
VQRNVAPARIWAFGSTSLHVCKRRSVEASVNRNGSTGGRSVRCAPPGRQPCTTTLQTRRRGVAHHTLVSIKTISETLAKMASATFDCGSDILYRMGSPASHPAPSPASRWPGALLALTLLVCWRRFQCCVVARTLASRMRKRDQSGFPGLSETRLEE